MRLEFREAAVGSFVLTEHSLAYDRTFGANPVTNPFVISTMFQHATTKFQLGRHAAAYLALAFLTLSCIDANTPEPWPLVSVERFACDVQPVLTTQCSTPACHGNPQRRMQVLAPGRMRMIGELQQALSTQSAEDRESGLHPALTKAERDFNLIQARAMIRSSTDETWSDSPLLTFPLAISAGGIYHAPLGDVFASKRDPGYVALSQWAAGLQGCP